MHAHVRGATPLGMEQRHTGCVGVALETRRADAIAEGVDAASVRTRDLVRQRRQRPGPTRSCAHTMQYQSMAMWPINVCTSSQVQGLRVSSGRHKNSLLIDVPAASLGSAGGGGGGCKNVAPTSHSISAIRCLALGGILRLRRAGEGGVCRLVLGIVDVSKECGENYVSSVRVGRVSLCPQVLLQRLGVPL